ncbi:hypothetical protein GGF46_003843 [Coemansia sp. RSA 552]|nr:hypothetical protein GGF46_003843 [Coemansia sp. RSA 552]
MADGSELPAGVAKALADKLYDRQRAALQQIEQLVGAALEADDEQRIFRLVAELSQDFATSEREAARIGGLVALAATAVALTHINVGPFLAHMVPPIVSALSDGESRVRYFACEALYNVAKVGRGRVLRWFNDIFDGLARVTADSVRTVKDGADYLDRLIKDIVAEQAATCLAWEEGTRGPRLAFSLDAFVPLLAERMHTYKPSTRLYLIEWIRVLDAVPGLGLVAYLPEFLDGLLRFLSDPSDDVRSKTQSVLGELLGELGEPSVEVDMGRCVDILVPHVQSNDQEIQGTALAWVLQLTWLSPAVVEQAVPRLINAVLPAVSHPVPAHRRTAEDVSQQLYRLVSEGPDPVRRRAPDHGSGPEEDALADKGLSDYEPQSASEPAVSRRESGGIDAEALSSSVREGTVHSPEVMDTEGAADTEVDEPFNYEQAATAVMELFAQNVHEATKVAGMRWLLLLHRKAPWRILTPDDMSFPVLLKMLGDSSEQVVKLDLELFAQISQCAYDDDDGDSEELPYLSRFLGSLLQMFATDRVLLETRGALMVRQLCVVLDPQLVFCLLARLLVRPWFSDVDEPESARLGEGRPELEFIAVMVQHLSWILVTAPETECLRVLLRRYSAALDVPAQQLSTLRFALLGVRAPRPPADSARPRGIGGRRGRASSAAVRPRGTSAGSDQLKPPKLVRAPTAASAGSGSSKSTAVTAKTAVSVPTAKPVATAAAAKGGGVRGRGGTDAAKGQRRERARSVLAQGLDLVEQRAELSRESDVFFRSLYGAWCHSPAACLTLCLLSQHYSVSARLVEAVVGQQAQDLTVSFLVQLDKLVQLIESPVFTFLRLQLLDGQSAMLRRTLFGLLMLLPQSSAFAILRNRLGAVAMLPGSQQLRVQVAGAARAKEDDMQVHYHFHHTEPLSPPSSKPSEGTVAVGDAQVSMADVAELGRLLLACQDEPDILREMAELQLVDPTAPAPVAAPEDVRDLIDVYRAVRHRHALARQQ